MECAVCLETVQPDMILCVNGHVMCLPCKKDQTCCPTCAQPFSNVEKPSVLTQMLETIPRLCKHTPCPTLVRPGSDHEVYCGWRLTWCKLVKCDWSGPARELRDHLKNKHSGRKIFTENYLPVSIQPFNPNQNNPLVFCFSFHGQFFWKVIVNDKDRKILTIQYICVPVEKPTLKLFLRFTFSSENSEHSTKLRLDFKPEPHIEDRNTFVVPQHILADFIDEEGRLEFDMEITPNSGHELIHVKVTE